MATPLGARVGTQPSGLVTISRAVVSAAAELVVTVERAVVGDANVRTARGNAWDALCADRARARARDEMDQLVRTLLADGPRPTPAVPPAPMATADRATAELVLAATATTTPADAAVPAGVTIPANTTTPAEAAQRPAAASRATARGDRPQQKRPTTNAKRATGARRASNAPRTAVSSPRSRAPQTARATGTSTG